MSGSNIKTNLANCSSQMPSMTSEVKISIEEIIKAMDVVGFRDEGRNEVAELIQDKFQDLSLGNMDCIPPELFEYIDTIKEVVGYLLQVST